MKSVNYNDIYETFRRIREAEDKEPEANVTREDETVEEAVPYTAQDTLMTNVLAASKQEFGADFNSIQNPMLYYPKDGDITLSGVIPEMNDAKFQFRYKVGDGAGCYVWSNPYMPISDKTIQTLQKVNGVCKNWRDEISKSEDCRPSNYNDPKDVQNNTQGQSQNGAGEQDGQSADMDFGQQQQMPKTGGAVPIQEHRILRRGDDIVEASTNRGFMCGDDLD